VNGAEYIVPVVSLGALPSVVYRIVAPTVGVEIVTVCAVVYVPPAGLIEGVATASEYPAETTALHVHPASYPIAFTVTGALSEIGDVYTVPTVSLGALPSSVYRIAAPAVDVDSVTV